MTINNKIKYTILFKCILFLLVFLFFSKSIFPQEPVTNYVIVRGVVVEGRNPLNSAIVKLFEGSNLVKEKTTMPNGKFMFKLNLQKDYLLTFTKEGYVKKKISFLTTVPENETGIWEYKFSIELFKNIEGLDVSILDKPISKIKYYDKSAGFDYDDIYTKLMRKQLARLMAEADVLRNSEYNQIIKQADKLYTDKKYDEAIDKYDEAIDLNPYSDYSDQKIYEIERYLRKSDAIDAAYQRAINEGDKNYNIQNYAPALSYFKKAISYKSLEEYPINKVTEIEKILKDLANEDESLKELNIKYRKVLTNGNIAIDKKDYGKAKINFTEALNLKPEEQYPKDQLLLIDKLIAENLKKEANYEEIEKAYKEAITQGDDYYFSKNYMEANAAYEKALIIKPEEKYPKTQIDLISEIFLTQKVIDKKYNDYITDADVLYKTQQYAKAKNLYKSALSIKPNEQFPKDQIVSIDAYFSSLDNLDQQYSNILYVADNYFKNKDFNNARTKYEEASGLKPIEDYPKNQITEIDKILLSQKNAASEEQLRNEQYNSTLKKAEQLFSNKDYSSSKRSFELALNIKPNEPYPVQKIGEINVLLKKIQQQRKEYDNIIEAADKKFSSNKYNDAKALYNNSLNLFPDELYPKSKIKEIDLKLSALLSAEELRKANENEYKENIRAGDSLFTLAEYNKSKFAFEKALELKPDEKYPKSKIDNILTELNKIKQLNEKYNTLIASADANFNTNYFLDAKSLYEKALELKPKEKYPKEQLIKVNQKIVEQQKLLADAKKLDEQYNSYISNADNAFKIKNYELAKSNYQSALNLKQNEQYPISKIKEIDDIYYNLNQINLSYKNEIEKADNYFNLKEFEFAKTYFKNALEILPNEQYPKDKIDEIDNILAQLKQKQKSYDKLIAIADKKYNDKKWTDAKSNYESALTYLPNEEYATNRISEINTILDNIRLEEENSKKIEQGYSEAIAQADTKFNSGNYIDAKNGYSKALTFKPDESYPKSKIIEIDNILEKEQKEKETTYNRAIASADSYLYQKKYSAAKSNYTKASNIFPDKEYPQLKLKEIDALLVQEAANEAKKAELESLYNNILSEANAFFKVADYVSAKANYKKALNYKPDATFPKKRLKEIEDLIKKQLLAEQAKSEEEKQQQIKDSKSSFTKDKDFDYSGEERKSKFLSELARTYPEGKTVENYNKPKKKILRIILNHNGIAKEYIKVQYSYGTFYFRNGQNISQGIFNSETRDK